MCSVTNPSRLSFSPTQDEAVAPHDREIARPGPRPINTSIDEEPSNPDTAQREHHDYERSPEAGPLHPISNEPSRRLAASPLDPIENLHLLHGNGRHFLLDTSYAQSSGHDSAMLQASSTTTSQPWLAVNSNLQNSSCDQEFQSPVDTMWYPRSHGPYIITNLGTKTYRSNRQEARLHDKAAEQHLSDDKQSLERYVPSVNERNGEYAAEFSSYMLSKLHTADVWAEICRSCQFADAVLGITDRCRRERGYMTVDLPLGSLRYISQKRKCPFCRSIAKIFKSPSFRFQSLRSAPDVTSLDLENCNISLRSSVNFGECEYLGQTPVDLRLWIKDPNPSNDSRFPWKKYCWLYFPNRMWPDEEIGRPYSPAIIDVPGIQQWLRCCDIYHPKCCHNPTVREGQLALGLEFLYLIDLENDCITVSSGSTQYAALSYVWGGVTASTTTRQNLEILRLPQSLTGNSSVFEIPQTVRDAMTITKALGIRYLWVDSLCILNDDDKTKYAHLQAMGSIYAQAYVTIVAAEGLDASHGIRGVNSSSRHHSVTNQLIDFPSCPLFANFEPLSDWERNSAWAKRAWTLQEALFSRRLLVFNGLVHWSCRTEQWREGVQSRVQGATSFSKSYRADQLGLTIAPRSFPDFAFWAKLVEDYQKRALTFHSDILNAFAGITRELSLVFPGGFHYGLPEMFFDIGLLWQSKRKIKRRSVNVWNYLDSVPAPSWSWVGWEGELDFLNWREFSDHLFSTMEGRLSGMYS